MQDKKIKILPYRIIPCDFGHKISKEIFQKIVTYLEKSQEWLIISKSEDMTEGEVLAAELEAHMSKASLYLHLFSDGVGIYTLIDEEEYEDCITYDPKKTLSLRKCAHRDLLTHRHELSKVLEKHTSNIRDLFDENLRRISAFSTWERKGLSYVMSFYFIDAPMRMIESVEFQKKLAWLLYPYYDERFDVEYSSRIESKDGSFQDVFRENFLSVVKKDCDLLPHIHTCASWSNLLVTGNITNEIVNDYWKLERDFQHVWFYTYITDKFIEHSLRSISTAVPERELEVLDEVLTEMMFKINQYEGVISSTMHERHFRLYEALRKTSRLDLLIESVGKKATLLKNRYNWLSEQRRKKVDTKIQLILFVIAVVSAVGAYEGFEKLGLPYSILLTLLSIIFGIYFFIPFLRAGNKRK